MSFKVNPLSFRSNKKIQNFFFNARFNKLPSGVFIENYIKSLLYAKDLYLINCQIVEKTEKNFIIFFSYYPFFKQYIHETVLFSKFKFSNKFTFFKKSLKNKRKSQKKDISFNYSKYFKKYQLKKKKIFLRKVVLVSYFRKLFNNKVIKLKQNVFKNKYFFFLKKLRWLNQNLFLLNNNKKIKKNKYRNLFLKKGVQNNFNFFKLQSFICSDKVINFFFKRQLEKTLNIKNDVISRNIRNRIPIFLKLIKKKIINSYSFKLRNIFLNEFIQITVLSFFFKNPEFILRFLALNLRNKYRKQLSFLKQSFEIMRRCFITLGNVKGLKLQVKGRLNKSLRTRIFVKSYGEMPTQTISAKIFYSQVYCTDRVGSYSLQLWYFF